MRSCDILHSILSYTDFKAFKKELCTKSTDDDVLTKRKEDIQSRIFQEPDERKLSILKSETHFQVDMRKEPAMHENIVSDGVDYESTKYSYDNKRLADGISIAQATTRNLTITNKINKFWKLIKLVEICGTLDPEGASGSNISRHGFFSSLTTQVCYLQFTNQSLNHEGV